MYMVFTPIGKSMPGFGTQYCAWHSDAGGIAYVYMPYMPDQGRVCWQNSVNWTDNAYGIGWFDGYSRVAGHEYLEMETDPTYGHGWLDAVDEEVGDKCQYGGTEDLTIGSHAYAVRLEQRVRRLHVRLSDRLSAES